MVFDARVAVFLDQDRLRWTCAKCGGAFSLHDGVCSECDNKDNHPSLYQRR